MIPDAASQVIGLLLHWLIYTGLLWGMIRIQKLNYSLPGLFGSSLLAVLIGLIPYVGGYLAYAVLLVCLWKVTGADIVPDVIFTVIIAGALMFAVNLFALGALMGDLRPDFGFSDEAMEAAAGEAGAGWAIEPELDVPTEVTGPAPAPPPVASHPTPAGAPAPPTSKGQQPSGASRQPGRAEGFVLKGISFKGSNSTAMLSFSNRLYTVSLGETISVQAREKPLEYRCEEITRTSVLLTGENGQRIQLRR